MESHKQKKRPTKIEEMTKDQIRQAILKKRECNAKAQKIVESLLEKCVTEEIFLKLLPEINQSHFEDVIEERSIIHMCGYPLCAKTISEKDIPKQKYRISIKTNKVYDITTRKSFCSNMCYKSAMYMKKQMLTSPLWFREYEEIPKFHLLPLDTCGSLGQEVDLGMTERINTKSERQSFTSINDFTSASLNEMSHDKETNNLIEKHINENTKSDNSILTEEKLFKLEGNKENTQINISDPIQKEEAKQKSVKKQSNPLNIVGEIIEKPEKKVDPILTHIPTQTTDTTESTTTTKKTTPKKQPSITVIMIEVEKCLAEWFTLDTMLYLFGEEKVKEMVADKGECIMEYLNNYPKGIFYNSNTYDQYQALCRKLNTLELEDRKQDSQTLNRETKPLPDYSILQEESKKIQLKVKAFFAGETDIPEPKQNNNTSSKPETGEDTTQLPLLDKNAQNALRQQIVCQHLNKVLPDLLRSLNLSNLSISAEVRLLVNTFKLKANNIMFKPIQWTLIAIVFIKLLTVRDKKLEYMLEQPLAYQHLQLLLLSYKQDGGYLDRLISWLTDIDRLLDINDTQLTIE